MEKVEEALKLAEQRDKNSSEAWPSKYCGSTVYKLVKRLLPTSTENQESLET
jgi:hypothetical protein